MVRIAARIGGSIPGHEPRFIPPSAALHICGTTRAGLVDDGKSVVDKYSKACIGKELGMDPSVIQQTAHGRRTVDTLKIICAEKATMEFESRNATQIEKSIPENYGSNATIIPGAHEMLDSVTASGEPLAIVTSASLPLLRGWVKVLDLPACPHLVTAESVEHGKPDPAGYLLAMKKLAMSQNTARRVVSEDSPAGICAAKAVVARS
ncbi:HAD-like domain protein [Akanthomyces lecanii RCEF 1005]|uniref:HAD-like domain protein n=1 Tax=Akanthomyces lecanii RCEF 1005 TaxID=1081108 RepID=A0A168DTZ0_CORDF|nr:HAD-like domain protein [Akanthomyces lecanii RCEF 1005]